ncbi:MAG: hypothetical protein JWP75_1146 [Frondihabitans sp.]|nr:hypothetical protein [Frondihabitans sp.]
MGRPRVPLLSHDSIVQAALSVGGDNGQFTLRDVAAKLGVKQASLYNHIGSKAELVDLMRAHVHEDMAVRLDVSSDWREAITAVAHAHRQILIDHPWLIPDLAESPAALGAAITTVENLATVLARAGFRSEDISAIIGAVDIVIIGASLDWFAPAVLFPRSVIEGSTDLARAIASAPRDVNRADAHFVFALTLLLDSLETRLNETPVTKSVLPS